MNNIKKFQEFVVGKNDQIYDYTPRLSPVGDFNKIDGINVLINSIRTLLLTPLGFYPFDPLYGSLLYKKVFEPLDKISQEEIEYEVRNRIERFDDRIRITQVESFNTGFDEKGFQINVYIKKGDVKGVATVHVPGPSRQFGLEDK